MKNAVIFLAMIAVSTLCTAQFDYDKDVYFSEGSPSVCKVGHDVDGSMLAIDATEDEYTFNVAICMDEEIDKLNGINKRNIGWSYGCGNILKEFHGDSMVMMKHKENVNICNYYKWNKIKGTYYVISDTTGFKEYDVKTLEIDGEKRRMNCAITLSVVCPEMVSNELLDAIRAVLIKKGYLDETIKSISGFKESLFDFQVENYLLVGFLDFETLEKMKIDKNLYLD